MSEQPVKVAGQLKSPEPWDRRRDRRTALVLFVLVWSVYLSTATYWVSQINDTRATTQSAWSLGTRGTLALPEEWRGDIDWEVEGVDGRLYTNRFPGPVIWAAPFHAVSNVLFPNPVPGHPFLLNYAPSGVAAATAAALGVVVNFLLFRRLADRRTAVAATLAIAFATGVWSVSADAMWPHGVTHLMIGLGLLHAAEDRPGRAGLGFAAAILARPHLAVVPAVIGVWNGVVRRSIRPVVMMGVASALGLIALVVYSRWLFGTWLPIAGYNNYAVEGLTGTPALEFGRRIGLTFFDPVRGLLIYVPVLIVLLPFLRHGWRSSPWWVRSAAVAGLAYLFIQLRANVHHGGAHFFGSRLTLEPLILWSPLLLQTWQAYVSRRKFLRNATVGLVLVGVVFHGLGATVWARPFFDRTAKWQEELDEICADPEVVGCPVRGIPDT